MQLDHLAPELLLHIFRSCDTVADVLHLAATNRRLRHVFSTSQKLSILVRAAEVEFGPLDDIIQLVTQNASQPAHLTRGASMSDALLKQIVEVGRVAQKWEAIYPLKKWKVDYVNRRLLTDEERYRLRRAVYRLWLYHRAFHNRLYDRFSRRIRTVVVERAQLLHNWSTEELAEIEDLRLVIQDVVQNHICPSNGTIQRKFRKRYPDNTQPLSFNIHLNYQNNLSTSSYFRIERNATTEFYTAHPTNPSAKSAATYNSRLRMDLFHDPGQEGWGDEIPHYYVVQDMLKLDPAQVLWLRENAPLREHVENYIQSLGEWFRNNGETFGDTLLWVLNERGEDPEELRVAIEEGRMGIAV
ncbi:hypothetical protein VTN77DRAFT_1497 [Rasamsonia byssochlamydoides]|uniref:uncharacterized protein n=1 Tax=Rasamsonia byssochlamydoides TaxID=89139 RepID=UPI003742FBE5